MYFSISPSVLSAALDSLKKFTDDRTAPVFIEAVSSTQQLIIRAGGKSASATVLSESKVSVAGNIMVNLENLLLIIRTYSGAQVHLRIGATGKFDICPDPTFPKTKTLSLPILPASTVIQTIAPAPIVNGFDIKRDDFLYAVEHVTALMKEDAQSPLTSVVQMKYEPDCMDFAMMSNRGFTVVNTKAECQVSGNNMVPISVLKSLPPTHEDTIHVSDCGTTMVFYTEKWTVVSCTFSANFPDYRTLMATAPTAKLSAVTKDLLPILRRSDLLLEAQNGIKSVIFDVQGNELHISLNSKKGDYHDVIMCRPDGLSAPVGFFVDDLIPSLLAVSADSTEFSWLNNAVTVKSDVKNETANVTCMVRTVQVQIAPTTQQASVPDVDSDLIASEEYKEEIIAEIEKRYGPDEVADAAFSPVGGDIDAKEAEEKELHVITEEPV